MAHSTSQRAIGALNVLNDMLAACVAPKGHDVTHTSLRGGGGRYYVPSSRAEELYDLYADAVCDAAGVGEASLVEQHRHIGPVVIDLDLRTPTLDRVATTERVDAFVAALGAELAPLLMADASHMNRSIDVYVLEKPPRPDAKKPGVFKDGVHFVLPGVVTRPELQVVLRAAMLPHVQRIFVDGAPCTNSAADIYDASVIMKNGWLAVGSRKPGEAAAWSLTRVLACDGRAVAAKGPCPPCASRSRCCPSATSTSRCRCPRGEPHSWTPK